MSSRRDPSTMGRSRRAPLRPGETTAERHARRLRVALAAQHVFEEWCEARGLALHVTDDGRLWLVQQDGCCAVQWWPALARAIPRKRSGEEGGTSHHSGIHCHDVDQLRELIARHVLGARGRQEWAVRP